jgi:hypothetical protein
MTMKQVLELTNELLGKGFNQQQVSDMILAANGVSPVNSNNATIAAPIAAKVPAGMVTPSAAKVMPSAGRTARKSEKSSHPDGTCLAIAGSKPKFVHNGIEFRIGFYGNGSLKLSENAEKAGVRAALSGPVGSVQHNNLVKLHELYNAVEWPARNK